MVIAIEKAAGSTMAALEYNEQKVSKGVAQMVYSTGIGFGHTPAEVFARYERGAIRAQKLSFHASFNPSDEENKKISDKQMVKFIREWADKMGYGKQPYLIYKHEDIGRRHFHMVSVRVDKHGNKISDKYEYRRSQKIVRELSEKYGIVLGQSDMRPNKYQKLCNCFDPYGGQNARQIQLLSEVAMQYNFSSFQQYKELMKVMGVRVEMEEHVLRRPEFFYYGQYVRHHRDCTKRMRGADIKAPSPADVKEHINHYDPQKMQQTVRRLNYMLDYAMNSSPDHATFTGLLAKHGVQVSFDFDPDDMLQNIFVIDHKSKTVLDMDSLEKGTLERMQEIIDNKWPSFEHDNQHDPDIGMDNEKAEHLAEKLLEIAAEMLDGGEQDPKKHKKHHRKTSIYG